MGGPVRGHGKTEALVSSEGIGKLTEVFSLIYKGQTGKKGIKLNESDSGLGGVN